MDFQPLDLRIFIPAALFAPALSGEGTMTIDAGRFCKENGRYEQPFEVSVTALEAITPDFVESLDPMGRTRICAYTSNWGMDE